MDDIRNFLNDVFFLKNEDSLFFSVGLAEKEGYEDQNLTEDLDDRII
jgi:hypothetical protein